MKNRINISIIGYGKMGKIRFESLIENKYVNIKSIYDKNSQDIPPNLEVKNIDNIFEDNELDGIIICTPNNFNFPFTKRGLKSGKFIFCEKPPAFNSEQIIELQNLEKSYNKFVMYGFNHRQHESIKKIKNLIDSKVFGKILWIRGRYGKSVDNDFFNSWRSKKELSGGGILFDQGIHMLDLFLHFVEDFDDVKAMISNSYWNLDIEDNVFAIFKNSKKNIIASLHSTMTQWRHLFSLEIFLEKGYIVLNGLKTSSGTYGKEELSVAINRSKPPSATWEDEKSEIFNNDDFWIAETDEFINSIIEERLPKFGDSAQAYNVLHLIERVYSNA